MISDCSSFDGARIPVILFSVYSFHGSFPNPKHELQYVYIYIYTHMICYKCHIKCNKWGSMGVVYVYRSPRVVDSKTTNPLATKPFQCLFHSEKFIAKASLEKGQWFGDLPTMLTQNTKKKLVWATERTLSLSHLIMLVRYWLVPTRASIMGTFIIFSLLKKVVYIFFISNYINQLCSCSYGVWTRAPNHGATRTLGNASPFEWGPSNSS